MATRISKKGRATRSFSQDTVYALREYSRKIFRIRHILGTQFSCKCGAHLRLSLSHPRSPFPLLCIRRQSLFYSVYSEDSKIYILRGKLSAPAGIARIKLLLLLGHLNLLSLAINLNVRIDIHFEPPCPRCLKRVPDAFRIKVRTSAVSVYRNEMWGKVTREHCRRPELINSNKTS